MGGKESSGRAPSALGTLLRKNVKLKRRRPLATVCEFLLPLVFVVLFAALKTLTAKVRVPEGWSLENRNSCAFETTPDQNGDSCSYPYAQFVQDVTSFAQVSANFQGTWSGHEFAKMFLATSTNATRESDALLMFVDWVREVGTAEGPIAEFNSSVFVLGSGSVEELDAYVTSPEYGVPAFSASEPEAAVALVFDKMDFEHAQFEYTLRLNRTGTAQRFEVPSTRGPPTDDIQRNIRWGGGAWSREYAESGFMTIQQVVDSFLIDVAGSSATNRSQGFRAPGVVDEELLYPFNTIDFDEYQPYGGKVMPFPVNEYFWDEFFDQVGLVFPLVFVLAYLYPVARILEGLVKEKETRTTEMLKMIGVPEWLIILSWYITYAVFFTVLSLIITLLSGSMLPSTTEAAGGFSVFVFFVFLIYGMSTVAFCFTLSTTFWKARTASFVGVILYFSGFFFFYSVNSADVDPKPAFALLLPQVSFSLIMQTIAVMEASGVGASMATLNEPVQGFTLSYGIVMLLFDIAFWTALGFYLTAVLPREFGQRLPFYFPLSPKYWRDRCGGRNNNIMSEIDAEDGSAAEGLVEPVDAALRQQARSGRGIQIRGLRKEFSTPSGKKVAVDRLDLDIYQGQILALLGHNGAGKTTTINLLSGMLPTSAGDAQIMGLSINGSMSKIRKSLGFCPQHDVLYPELSVREHLWFYGSLKGLSGDALREAIAEGITQVGLVEKTNVRSSALSGGMKRKLSVAIALIGGSKVVFVDEPTSGVDPWSRRSIWEVLQNSREGRVIVLTTHFMDEADLLGDRIAIMAEGRLKCCGSSLFLKNKFGAGYLLTMIKDDTCNVPSVTAVVTKYVQGAKVVSNVGTEVSYQLPAGAAASFAAMFREIEETMPKLGVLQYGISVTTLEEVFLKVARADDQQEEGGSSGNFGAAEKKGAVDFPEGAEIVQSVEDDVEDAVKVQPVDLAARAQDSNSCGRFALHFGALFRKRAQYARRDGRSFLCSIIMPIALYAFGLLSIRLTPVGETAPAYVLSTDEFNPSFPEAANSFMPIVELDDSDQSTTDVTDPRVFSPEYALERLDGYSAPGPNETLEVFGFTYQGGWPTAADCNRTACNRLPPPAHGGAVLEFARTMLDPKPERKGASLYAAAIVQKRPAVLPHSCLITTFEISVDPPELVLNYVADPCSDPNSPCLLLEAPFGTGTACVPGGCLSNLYQGDTIEQLFSAAVGPGGGLTGGEELSEEEQQQQFEALVTSSRIMSCQGSLCNTGPTNLLNENVCRGPEEGSTCVADDLVSFAVNSTTLQLSVDLEAVYCDGRNATELAAQLAAAEEEAGEGGEGSAQPESGGGGSSLPPGGPQDPSTGVVVDNSPRSCQSSGIPQYLLGAVAEFVLSGNVSITIPGLNPTPSYADGACLDETIPDCTFKYSPLPNNQTLCLVDSCAPGGEAAFELLRRAVFPLLEGAQDQPCEAAADLCNGNEVDLGLVSPLLDEQAFFLALNETATALFGTGLDPANAQVLFEGIIAGSNDTAVDSIFEVILMDSYLREIVQALLLGGQQDPDQPAPIIDLAEILERLQQSITEAIAEGPDGALAKLATLINQAQNADGTIDPDALLNLLLVGDDASLSDINLGPLLGGNNLTASPEFTDFAVELVRGLSQVNNTVQACSNPADQCVMGEVLVAGQTFCVPTGCEQDFDEADYFWLPPFTLLLAQATAVGEEAQQTLGFEDVEYFACNSTECNYGCRRGGNCAAAELEPVRYNSTTLGFAPADDVCPVVPLRYTYTMMVNSTARHVAPVTANAIHNALLRTKLGKMYPGLLDAVFGPAEDAPPMPYIRTANKPLELTNNVLTLISGILAFVAAIFALIAFAFIPASTASYVVLEREEGHNVKHQQMVSGAGIISYWLSLYVFDLLMYMVPFAGALGLVVAFDMKAYVEDGAMQAVAIVFLSFGLSAIAFSYLTSNLFRLHTTALIGTLFINLFTGLVLMIASYTMSLLDNPAIVEGNAAAKPFYRIFPGFCLGDSLLNLATLQISVGLFGQAFEVPSPLDWDQTGANIAMMLGQAVVFFSLVLGLELLRSYPKLAKKVFRDPHVRDPAFEVDEDVEREEERVLGGRADDDLIRIERMRKVYRGRGKKVAVRGVTLGIPEGECFGYLGINGAGKTTTLKMLTGDIYPTEGTAYFNGLNVLTQQRAVRSLIGYCPQFDALLPLLTVREHLQLFGRIKGLSGDSLEQAVLLMMRKLTLTPFERKLARSLSGGNKRKLSLAIAAIGSPRILFADEPSTGMDPVSRRFMWDVLEKMCSGELTGVRTSVILTTHSMEECEALCTRIGIMVGGRLRCLGSGQHLKSRFAKGLLAEFKLGVPKPDEVTAIHARVSGLPSTLTEEDMQALGDALGNSKRVDLITGRDDSAWGIWSHLDNEGEIDIESVLEWWLIEDVFASVRAFIDEHFPGATLVERHDTQVRFKLPSSKLSRVFELLEGNKLQLNITEYGVSQATLEQIFNRFASQQEEETGRARGVVSSA